MAIAVVWVQVPSSALKRTSKWMSFFSAEGSIERTHGSSNTKRVRNEKRTRHADGPVQAGLLTGMDALAGMRRMPRDNCTCVAGAIICAGGI